MRDLDRDQHRAQRLSQRLIPAQHATYGLTDINDRSLRVGEDDPVERWDIHAFGQTLGIADQQGLRQIRIAEVGAMLLLLRVCPILVGQQPFEIETRDADLVMVALRTSFPHTKNRFVRHHR